MQFLRRQRRAHLGQHIEQAAAACSRRLGEAGIDVNDYTILDVIDDLEDVRKALGALDLFVVQELFMTETAKLAHVVLPGASFLEKSGTFTNGERRIQRVNAAVEPIPGTKSDGQSTCDNMELYAKKTGSASGNQ